MWNYVRWLSAGIIIGTILGMVIFTEVVYWDIWARRMYGLIIGSATIAYAVALEKVESSH